MATGRRIGDDFRSAVDWTQARLRTTRPIAEDTVWSAIHARALLWDSHEGGVYLLEDDEGLEQRKNSTILVGQKKHNAVRKWTRLQFRNRKRSAGKMSESPQRKHPGDDTLPDPVLGRDSLYDESPPPAGFRRALTRLLEKAGQRAVP